MLRLTRKKAIILSLVILGLVALIFAVPISAQQPVTDDEVNEIAKKLYCPVCESTPLDVCPTQACADWREVIRIKLSEGQSEEEIRAYFEEQYGPRALSEPPREGFTLAIWILPIAAVVVGAFVFSRYLRNIRKTAEGEPGDVEETTAGTRVAPKNEYEARIEEELSEM